MEEAFELQVIFKGNTYTLDVQFIQTGYIHQFRVKTLDWSLIFELDEERNYRVINTGDGSKEIPQGLIETILEQIQKLHE